MGSPIIALDDVAATNGATPITIDVLANDSATTGFAITLTLTATGDTGISVPLKNAPAGDASNWYASLTATGEINGGDATISLANFTFTGSSVSSSGDCATGDWTGDVTISGNGMTSKTFLGVQLETTMCVNAQLPCYKSTTATLSATGLDIHLGRFLGLYPGQSTAEFEASGFGQSNAFGPPQLTRILSQSDEGSVTIIGAAIVYAPLSASNLLASFVYQITDGLGQVATALVTVNGPDPENNPTTACDCDSFEVVQYGKGGNPILDGAAARWSTMTQAERATVYAALVAFTQGAVGNTVGTPFAQNFGTGDMFRLYDEVAAFGWTVAFSDLSFVISGTGVNLHMPGPAFRLDIVNQVVKVNTVKLGTFSIVVPATVGEQAANLHAALAEMTSYTPENAAAQQDIASNRKKFIRQVIAKLQSKKPIYLAAAQSVDSTLTSEGFDEAACLLARAYVDGVQMFLKSRWGARPFQSQRTNTLVQNLYNWPWCGDWNNFFDGLEPEVGQGMPTIPSYWAAIKKVHPEIWRYFTLWDAQAHDSTTESTPQHNFELVTPVRPTQPYLVTNTGRLLSMVGMTLAPGGQRWLGSDDFRIIVFDPWGTLRPMAYTIDAHKGAIWPNSTVVGPSCISNLAALHPPYNVNE